MMELFRAAAAIAIAVLMLVPALARGQESRVALVVGNAAYKHSSPLRNPVRDANAMATALQEFGFEVIKVENADRGRMATALIQFGRKLKADGVALFFYAGHGIQVAGANYLIPVEADITEEAAASMLGVDLQQVLRVMENAGSRLSMVFLDACRDNPFERAFRSGGARGLAAVDAPRGTLLAYATAPGKTAADGDGANGLFTAELLKAMSRPGLTIDEVLKEAGAGVEKASGNKQVPWINSSYRGKFYFFVNVTTEPAGLTPASNNEALFWSSIKDSSDGAEFDAYLKQYPNGAFAALAKARLDRIAAAKARPPVAQNPIPSAATSSPADQAFDGKWDVTLTCGSAVGLEPFRFFRSITFSLGAGPFEVGNPGQPGSSKSQIRIGSDGGVLMLGEVISRNPQTMGKAFPIEIRGKADRAAGNATGHYGDRKCELALKRS
jgi:hypothetical protein